MKLNQTQKQILTEMLYEFSDQHKHEDGSKLMQEFSELWRKLLPLLKEDTK